MRFAVDSKAPTNHGAWSLASEHFSGAIAGAVIVALSLAGAAGRAHEKLFWHDEIFTITLAGLPLREQWSALLHGVDAHPPLFFAITRFFSRLAGEGHIALRLPGMAGVMIGALAVGMFVRRRCGSLAGLVGMMVLLNSVAYTYAYEARPYGLVVGFSGLAIVCWQHAASNGVERRRWLAGLLLALAAAIACHYFAVLLLVPLAVAEVSRFVRSRRTDWPLWLSLSGGAVVPLIIFLPHINVVRSLTIAFFSPSRLRTVLDMYQSAIADFGVPAIAVLGVAAIAIAAGGKRPDVEPRPVIVPPHEWFLAVALLALPVIAYLLGFVTGGFVSRYSIQWTLGLSIIVPLVLASLRGSGRILIVSAAGVLFVWTAAREGASARWLLRPRPTISSVYPSLLTRADERLPVVVTHGHLFLVLVHYAPHTADRLFYLTGSVPPDDYRDFKALTQYKPLGLGELDEFLRQHQHFLIYGPTPMWITSELLGRGAVLVLLGQDTGETPFAMSLPGPSSLFEVTVAPSPG